MSLPRGPSQSVDQALDTLIDTDEGIRAENNLRRQVIELQLAPINGIVAAGLGSMAHEVASKTCPSRLRWNGHGFGDRLGGDEIGRESATNKDWEDSTIGLDVVKGEIKLGNAW